MNPIGNDGLETVFANTCPTGYFATLSTAVPVPAQTRAFTVHGVASATVGTSHKSDQLSSVPPGSIQPSPR